MTIAIGSQAKLGFGTTSTVDKPLEFISESIKKVGTILDTNGIRGTRSHASERSRVGPYTVSGQIVCNPTPLELNDLGQFIMGGAPLVGTPAGSTTFPVAEALPAALFINVERIGKRFVYDLCKIVRATFSASEGQLLTLTLDIEGGTETVSATAFPALTYYTDQPFTFMDAVFTINGTTATPREFEVVIENTPLTDRFLNSTTRASIPIIDRNVTFRCAMPYDTANEIATYDVALASQTTASIVFTNGTKSMTISLAGKFQIQPESPTINGKGEMVLPIGGVARKVGQTLGTTDEISLVIDST